MTDVDRFTRWSRTYEESRLQTVFFDRVHHLTLETAAQLSAPQVVVDVGCGTGRLLRAVHRKWPAAQLIGVDPASGMIEVARTLNSSATFHVGAAENLPLADASADLVLSTVSFHHWSDPAAGIREVARVLSPGGHFVLSDAVVPAWLAWLIRHKPFLNSRERVGLVEGAGLRVIEQRSLFWNSMVITVAVHHAPPRGNG